ncbi:hypothetical protein BC939DRAFT_499837 [Gamsiella multidivaricata]|uniref:uncharacterized protein n=1 Tax=Gamsiella multidivaricata TaxID=101098 RepID=UPI00221EB97D|nr:uncharacterized protein BC939DRAFT_499837 [Gamsiella multidivaricata]KAI7829710.1 hypothetical protein BC939DRAFT_499837 [Gamsiella multidivaricata]
MPANKFFVIPELVYLMSQYLSLQDILHLLHTNRQLHKSCAPLFYETLDLRSSAKFSRLFESREGLKAMSRNVHHVRHIWADDIYRLYCGLWDHTTGKSLLLDDNNGTSMLASDVPRAQTTRLTRLECHMYTGGSVKYYVFFPLYALTLGLAAANPHLGHLDISAKVFSNEVSLQALQEILNSCPPSVECIKLGFTIVDQPFKGGPSIVKQEPLRNLKRMHLPVSKTGYPAQVLCAILEQCPMLEAWSIPCLSNMGQGGPIANTIRKHCPRLRDLSIDGTRESWRFESAIRIMGEIGPQHLESALRSNTIVAILSTCEALKHLAIITVDPRNKCAITLEDAITLKWACERIQHLEMLVDIGQRRIGFTNRFDVTKDSRAELWWRQFEAFYIQIGCLTRLKALDLKIGDSVNGGNIGRATYFYKISFPRMLSLQDNGQGNQGYLSCLAGLRELRELRGSVYADTSKGDLIHPAIHEALPHYSIFIPVLGHHVYAGLNALVLQYVRFTLFNAPELVNKAYINIKRVLQSKPGIEHLTHGVHQNGGESLEYICTMESKGSSTTHLTDVLTFLKPIFCPAYILVSSRPRSSHA